MRGKQSEHLLTVTAKKQLAPHMLRLDFTSPTYFEGWEPQPGMWSRLWFPDSTGEAGEHQRGYTLVEPDLARGSVSFDFLLHHPAGPASAWAQRAEVGDTLLGIAPGSHSFVEARGVSAVALVGDAASIPAFNEILARGTAAPTEVVLVRHSDSDVDIPVEGAEAVRWVEEDGVAGLIGKLCEANPTVQIWGALERGLAASLRKEARRWANRKKSNTLLQGYWVRGAAMGIRR